jgi:hypothetical protein
MDHVNYTVQKAWKALHFVMRILKKGNRNTKRFAKKGASLSAEALLGEPGGGAHLLGTRKDMGRRAQETGITLCGSPAGEPVRGLVLPRTCQGPGDGHLSP